MVSSSNGAVDSSLIEDPSSPYFVHHSENHSSIIVTPELTSTNYASWKQSFLLAVSIGTRKNFLKVISLNLQKMIQNFTYGLVAMICWFLRSISPPIASTVFYMHDALQIWRTLYQRFSQLDDTRICCLQHLLCTTVQGTNSFDVYFTQFNAIWEKLKSFRPPPYCKCGSCNQACFQKYIDTQQKDYVFKFIKGLHESFNTLKT